MEVIDQHNAASVVVELRIENIAAVCGDRQSRERAATANLEYRAYFRHYRKLSSFCGSRGRYRTTRPFRLLLPIAVLLENSDHVGSGQHFSAN